MAPVTHDDHVVNYELLKLAQQQLGQHKRAFVPGGAPDQGGGPPPGGPPPGGGAPPPDGGMPDGGPDPMSLLMQKLTALEQRMNAGGAGGAGGAGAGALKPKIDEPSVLLQILKTQARIADALGVQIPASEMVVNQNDLGQLAQATQSGQPLPGMDPTAQQSGAGGPPPGSPGIQPVAPVSGPPGQGKTAGSYVEQGHAFDPAGLSPLGAGGARPLVDPGVSRSNGELSKRAQALLMARRGQAR